MTEHEPSYTTSECEALEVVLDLDKSRVYLFSVKLFIVYSDPKSLQTAFIKEEIHE